MALYFIHEETKALRGHKDKAVHTVCIYSLFLLKTLLAFSADGSFTVPEHLHLAHSGFLFHVFAFCIHSFSEHLRSVPYGPNLPRLHTNRISESVIKRYALPPHIKL